MYKSEIKNIVKMENMAEIPELEYSLKEAMKLTDEFDKACIEKLAALQYWENIKRIGMMHLLEEVIKVQALEKKINRLERKKANNNSTTIDQLTQENNSKSSYESDEDNSDEDTKELAAADASIENLTKSTFNSTPKFEEIYQLMVKFAKPMLIPKKEEKMNNTPIGIVGKIPEEYISQNNSKKRKRNSSISSCFSPILPEKRQKLDKPHKRPEIPNDDGISPNITIGSNGTTVTRKAWNGINWGLSGPAITRKILMEVFDRSILAFHTLTGKPSPAFTDYDMPKKNQLDADKVSDIIELMTKHFNMTSREVRSAITTKCADENKMHRQRQQKTKKDATTN